MNCFSDSEANSEDRSEIPPFEGSKTLLIGIISGGLSCSDRKRGGIVPNRFACFIS